MNCPYCETEAIQLKDSNNMWYCFNCDRWIDMVIYE